MMRTMEGGEGEARGLGGISVGLRFRLMALYD